MNYFRNELRHLEKENKQTFQQINDTQSRQKIVKMWKYLSASSLSLYQLQVIKKDLIGMALEAETEHLRLEDKLGIDFKDFCDDIIQNAQGNALWEHIMHYVLTLLETFTIWFTIKFILLNSAPATFGIDYADLVWIIIWCIGGIYLAEFLDWRLAIYQTPYRKLPSLLCRICAFFCFIWLLTTPLSSSYIIEGNGWVILAVIIILLLTVTIIMNLHWEKCSKKFSH